TAGDPGEVEARAGGVEVGDVAGDERRGAPARERLCERAADGVVEAEQPAPDGGRLQRLHGQPAVEQHIALVGAQVAAAEPRTARPGAQREAAAAAQEAARP